MKALTLPGWPACGTNDTSPATRLTSPTSPCAWASALAAMKTIAEMMRIFPPLPFSILRRGNAAPCSEEQRLRFLNFVDADDLVHTDRLGAALDRECLDLAGAHALAGGLDSGLRSGNQHLKLLGNALQPRCCIDCVADGCEFLP